MLSVANVRTAGGAANYFAADNYYTRADADRSGEWLGKGAAALGLAGSVDARQFEAVLIALLALHFDVPVEMLGGKEGPTVGQRSIVKVPLLNGTGNDSRSQWRLVDAAWLGRLCDQPASVAILPIVGEAMEPTLCNGDEVMISRVRFQESVREGLYAIRGSSEIFVRRIAIDPTKNRLTVLTDHPAYPSWQGIQRKGVDIVGRVIWIGARVA